MKPVILVTCEHGFDSESHVDRFVLNKPYTRAISAGGGIPVLAADPDQADCYAELCGGLLLTGGSGVHPARFGEVFFDEDSIKGSSNMPRDDMEFRLVEAFVAKGKPIMGICRGHQLLNVFFGGKLIQNFPKHTDNTHQEHQGGIAHTIQAEADSVLGRLFGTEFLSNSYHRDAAVSVGTDMRITAKSADGVIEALEHKTRPIFGVQWHPERQRGDLKNPPTGPDMTPLFTYFAELCSK